MAPRTRLLGPCVLVSLLGCGASLSPPEGGDAGTDGCERIRCVASLVCAQGVCVDACHGECTLGQTCSYGQCVDESVDEDSDGYAVIEDCDDRDPDIIPGSELLCASDCGDGTMICIDGAWSTCTAPAECTCTPGETMEEVCGRCGQALRQCGGDGEWSEPGQCENEGDCDPGIVDEDSCGKCGTRSRSCDADCSWLAWGTCGGQHGCLQGNTRSCGDCGTQTCTDECRWGTCAGEGSCSPGDTRACGDCGTQTCTEECDWGSCLDGGVCCPCQPPGTRTPNGEPFENFCYYAPDTPDCPMTQDGGYCDPDGSNTYEDGDWNRGYLEYQARCP